MYLFFHVNVLIYNIVCYEIGYGKGFLPKSFSFQLFQADERL